MSGVVILGMASAYVMKLRQELADEGAEGAVVSATSGFGLAGFHHGAHRLFIGGAELGDDCFDE